VAEVGLGVGLGEVLVGVGVGVGPVAGVPMWMYQSGDPYGPVREVELLLNVPVWSALYWSKDATPLVTAYT
jgi:hypothetical protein